MSKHEEDGEFIRKGPAPFFIVLFDSSKAPMATMEGIESSFEKYVAKFF
ncbi:hypothetical protein H8K52_20745, partial [Undibacterium seohonense]|nr:hypothetical protein [Undibacterium seohonense]